MKKTAILSIVALLAFSVSAFAQERKVEFSDWEKQIKAADSTLNVLKAKEAACKEDGKNLKAKLEQTKANTAKTEEEILALVEANKDSKAAYGKELDAIENRIKQLAALSNDELFARRAELDVIEADLNKLRMNKLSLLSENSRRIEGMVSQIDKLRKVQPTTQTYTVGTWSKDRDCLWNIAKKKTIYDNPFKWPSLYNANKDKIKDPNLIYPGQILSIPKAN
ncbi:MAG: LysM peptidoglycan-binding domain-containing protein [Bacteroidetes bacterium]|nr:LysM peptidoglycan-binding domain-containing protein [Bacteroidota bacterium]